MSSLSVRLPDSLHDSLRQISKKDHVSINQFIATAVAEKIAALETEDYLAKRAAKANKNDFMTILSNVPDTEPDDFDR